MNLEWGETSVFSLCISGLIAESSIIKDRLTKGEHTNLFKFYLAWELSKIKNQT